MTINEALKHNESEAIYHALGIFAQNINPFNEGSKGSFKSALEQYMDRDLPIQISFFWGIGDKKEPDGCDNAWLDHMVKIREKVTNVYPHGLNLAMMVATNHGIRNGYIPHQVAEYSNNIAVKARQRDIFPFDYGVQIDAWLQQNPVEEKYISSLKWTFNHMHNELRQQLIQAAAKHNVFVKIGKITAEEAAREYYVQRNLEGNYLKKIFNPEGEPQKILAVHGAKDSSLLVLPKNILQVYLAPMAYLNESVLVPWFHQ